MSDEAMGHLRDICLRLPEAAESVSVHHPSFKVRGKTFAMFVDGGDRPAVWIKAPHGVQHELTATDADRFFVPPYLGPSGWVGAYVDRSVDWAEIGELLTDGYRMAAPKRLQARLDEV